MNTRHRDRRRALRTRVDDSATTSCEHEEVSDDRCTVALTDEDADLLAGDDPGVLPQDVASAHLDLVGTAFIGVNVYSPGFPSDDAYAIV